MSDEPAFPWGEHGTALGGLSKRELFAAIAMNGLMGRVWQDGKLSGEEIILQWTASAVICADALLAELEKPR